MMKKILFSIVFLLCLTSVTAAVTDTIQVYSASMQKNSKICVVVPNSYKKSKKTFPVVYLLHGHGGNYATWSKRFKALSEQVDQYEFIAIGVDGAFSSWYFDSPIDPTFRYETYISSELIPFIDQHYKTIPQRESRAITGLSMGGHGAFYLALKHPELFGAAGSMSGGLDFTPFPEKWDIKKRLGTFEEFPENWILNTVTNLIHRNQDNKVKMIFDCGVDDFFIDVNRALHQKMLSLKIDHDYIERPGKHDIKYWENALRYQLLFFSDYFKTNDAKK